MSAPEVNIPLGVGLLIVAGAAIGNWLLPVKILAKRRWRWEHTFLFYSLFQCIIIPWVVVLIADHNIFTHYGEVPWQDVVWVIGMGFLWGCGNAIQAFLVPIIGIGLCSTINPATVIGFGALLPLLIYTRYEFENISGWLVVIGFVVSGLAIVCSFFAGYYREKGLIIEVEENPISGIQQPKVQTEQTPLVSPEANAKPQPETRTVIIGSIFCVIAGFLAALLNIGFVNGETIVKLVEKKGNIPWLSGSSTWALAFGGATLPSFGSCIFRLVRNGTWNEFKPEGNKHFVLNVLLAASAALLQYIAFSFFGVAARSLGSLGASVGFACFESIGIILANIVAIVLQEWKYVGHKRAYIFLAMSIFMLLCAITIMVLSVSEAQGAPHMNATALVTF